MKTRKLIFAVLLAAVAIPGAVPVFAANDNPPGPAGGPGTNWDNVPCAANAPGVRPDRLHRRLTAEQRTQLKAMTQEQRQAFFKERCEERLQQRLNRDGNPPGPYPDRPFRNSRP